MSTNFEKYIAGQPINEELKALREGRLPEISPFLVTGIPEAAQPAPGGDKRPLSRSERIALKELRDGPSWPVIQFLLKKATLLHVDSATLLSQDDPLGKNEEIAQLWAYVKMFKRAHSEFNLLVEAEISELDAEVEK
jgi:hypothetical protein